MAAARAAAGPPWVGAMASGGSSPEYDVAVVGYGPTGAVLANLLGRAGLRVLVVERAAATSADLRHG